MGYTYEIHSDALGLLSYLTFDLASRILFGTNSRCRKRQMLRWLGPCEELFRFFGRKDRYDKHREGLAMNSEIESVARAMHSAEEDTQLWECEPDSVKEEFRSYARAALEMLAQHRWQQSAEAEPVSFPYAA